MVVTAAGLALVGVGSIYSVVEMSCPPAANAVNFPPIEAPPSLPVVDCPETTKIAGAHRGAAIFKELHMIDLPASLPVLECSVQVRITLSMSLPA